LGSLISDFNLNYSAEPMKLYLFDLQIDSYDIDSWYQSFGAAL